MLVGRRVALVGFLVLVLAPTGMASVWACDWPMFCHDLERSGVGPGQAPEDDYVHWTFTTGGPVQSCPAVVDGMVFIGSYDDRVYALNRSTGSMIWNYTTGDDVLSSPAVTSGVVFVGSKDGTVYALNQTTGVKIWDYYVPGRFSSSPAVADGMVFIGSDNTKVYALNQTTGAWIWEYTTGFDVRSSAAVVDGMVFIGSLDRKVYALNQTTGAWIWEYTTGGLVISSPAIADGVVFIGSYDGKVYALNMTNGMKKWEFATGNNIEYSSPALADGMVFIGAKDNKVYALNQSTGVKIWNYTTGAPVTSSPALADGMVFIGSFDGGVYALNQSTGTKVWNYTTGDYVHSSPAVADGMVFIGSDDNKVYAFGTPSFLVNKVLDVEVDVGSPVFRGDLIEFFISTSLDGQLLSADITSVVLYYGNGTVLANLTSAVVGVSRGIFKVPYLVASDAPNGSYYLLVEAYYFSFEEVEAIGVSHCTFLISSTLTEWAAWLAAINATLTGVQGSLAVVQSDVGTLLLDLVSINASIMSIHGTIATIESDIGSIQVDLANLSADLSDLVSTLEDWQVITTDLDLDGVTFNLQVLTNSTLDDVSLVGYEVTVTVSGSDGTSGVAHVWVPKGMLDVVGSSIDVVVVTINDEPVAFSVSEGDANYVLTMTYTHSVDVIKIYLRGVPPVFPWQLVIFAVILVGIALSISVYVYKNRMRG